MYSDDIQNRLNAMSKALLTKGKSRPTIRITMRSDEGPSLTVQTGEYGVNEKLEFIRGNSIDEMLDKADAFIANLPDAEEARRHEFMTQLAKTIELGRANGIDVEFVNPLIEQMKKLSANAIGWTPPRPLADDIPF